MGGSGATGDMIKAHVTQAWLAVSNDALALSSGEYFFHLHSRPRYTRYRQFGINIGDVVFGPDALGEWASADNQRIA